MGQAAKKQKAQECVTAFLMLFVPLYGFEKP
jgi:hypothetical protein